MYFLQVICAMFIFVSHATALGYGTGGGMFGGGAGGQGIGGMYGGGAGGHGSGGMYGGGAGGFGSGGIYGGGSGASSGEQHYPPTPYEFGYQAPDESGNKHFRKEQGDGSGNVQGSYGYVDTQGLYRQVDYIANKGGFKANVKTNEPGTDGKENPADVRMNVQEPPRGIQEKYTGMSSGYGGGSSSGGGHYGGMNLGASVGKGGSFGGVMGGGQFNMGKFGGGSGFSGIPRSSSGKSGY